MLNLNSNVQFKNNLFSKTHNSSNNYREKCCKDFEKIKIQSREFNENQRKSYYELKQLLKKIPTTPELNNNNILWANFCQAVANMLMNKPNNEIFKTYLKENNIINIVV